MRRIGLVGLGRMGLPICTNLVDAGYQVVASDVREACKHTALAIGASWVDTNAGAAAQADVLVTVLPGPNELLDAMVGRFGAADALRAGASWIDMSTNSPSRVAPIRERVRARGVDVLEAPMGGGVPAARAGTLQFFVGGDPTVFERHLELLQVLGDPDRIVLMGGMGAGYTTKLLVNLLWFGQAVATAEALLLARRAGIELGLLQRTLGASQAASVFIRRDLDALLAGDHLASFGLDRCCEQLATVTGLAEEARLPFELSGAVAAVYQRALSRFGATDGELLPVALLEEQAGVQLRRG